MSDRAVKIFKFGCGAPKNRLEQEFEECVFRIQHLRKKPIEEDQLRLYGLYQQIVYGDNFASNSCLNSFS